MSGMTMQSSIDGARALIALDGELDLASVADLDAEVDRLAALGHITTVVVDLRELAFMDSSGLRSVVLAEARLGEQGKHLVLIKGPDTVQRVFDITRMAGRFTFVADPDELEDAA